ncbi:MAG: putative Ribonuclease [Candidatus Saccharibacteria bacterium]|nr:putative Ribonuclease [Candidatus Saccharibacteria bacterium]
MIPFKNRFHGHGSLRYVYAHGHAVRSHLLTLKHSSHPKRKEPRIAVVISKKVIKAAVGRNRVRRRLYEIVRQELPTIQPNSDIVLLVFSAEVFALPQKELEDSVKQLLASAGVYKK